MSDDYQSFLASKLKASQPVGFEPDPMHASLFPFQRDIVGWALRQGRCAIFADTGLGKSRMACSWARQVSARAGKVLMLAPLAVAAQTVREGAAIDIPVTLCRDGADVRDGINITNYDRLHRFDPSMFGGVVLDESSCIKHHDAKTLALLIAAFGQTPYRLAATATPAPNDFAELGTHAEFLGICSRQEMLAEYFVHDGSETQTWRLKGHARRHFWRWVSSWGALVRRPSDLGYDDSGYALPPLEVHHHVAPTDTAILRDMGVLFAEQARDLTERRNARKASISKRVELCALLVKGDPCAASQTTTASITSSATTATLSTAQSDVHTDPEPQRKIASTCEPTTSRTNTAGLGVRRRKQPNTTQDDGMSTPLIPPSAPSSKRAPDNGASNIQSERSPKTYGPTALPSPITSVSSPSKEADAPYVESRPALTPTIAAKNAEGFMLITATAPASSGDCSAPTAIWDSENSETTPVGLNEQQPISGERWVIWCDFNAEQDALEHALGDECISIYGSLDADEKERRLTSFINGNGRFLLGKPSIFGWGINLQMVARMAFVGVSDSWESYYQAVRRVYRFGQKRPVHVHIFSSEAEGSVIDNLKRKEADAKKMADELSVETRDALQSNILRRERRHTPYEPSSALTLPPWMRSAPNV